MFTSPLTKTTTLILLKLIVILSLYKIWYSIESVSVNAPVLEDITCLEYIDYLDNINLFFAIPMLIFCIEYTIKKMMSTTYK